MAAGAKQRLTMPPRSEALVMVELAAGTHHIGQLGLVELWPSQGAEGLMVGHTWWTLVGLCWPSASLTCPIVLTR